MKPMFLEEPDDYPMCHAFINVLHCMDDMLEGVVSFASCSQEHVATPLMWMSFCWNRVTLLHFWMKKKSSDCFRKTHSSSGVFCEVGGIYQKGLHFFIWDLKNKHINLSTKSEGGKYLAHLLKPIPAKTLISSSALKLSSRVHAASQYFPEWKDST